MYERIAARAADVVPTLPGAAIGDIVERAWRIAREERDGIAVQEGYSTDLGEIALTPGTYIAGLVTDSLGNPITRADVLVGTPQYMAPEMISAPGQASHASDLYALGHTLADFAAIRRHCGESLLGFLGGLAGLGAWYIAGIFLVVDIVDHQELAASILAGKAFNKRDDVRVAAVGFHCRDGNNPFDSRPRSIPVRSPNPNSPRKSWIRSIPSSSASS